MRAQLFAAVAILATSAAAQPVQECIAAGGCGPAGMTPPTITLEIQDPRGHVIGTSYRVAMLALALRFRTSPRVLIVGFANPRTPIPPALVSGAIGCILWASPEVVVTLPPGGVAIAVPNDPGLRGVTVFHQAVGDVVDTQSGARGVALSHGCDLVLL